LRGEAENISVTETGPVIHFIMSEFGHGETPVVQLLAPITWSVYFYLKEENVPA
jgi:hypothetical protein